ncbi:DEAD/DEAH box helicase [uncultured Dokdonia sp.]|uniref:DEAD/DEAH box helicase n=1 Tax=uncultured Dokdonia sp. TaxID=575653 RepID=UPI002628F469|nr:DEAD/DEAH box helicase [uncultured Dokdonia sp.]
MSFKSLGLSDALLKAVSEKGYTTPSPIQQKAIPKVLEGKDVLASAQTGTGKTAGFTLPMLHNLIANPRQGRRKVRALVLTPTRELAAQIYDNVREYSKYVDIKSTVIFGGVNQNPQVRTIRQGVDILVATPGRLLDLENQGLLSLSDIEFLVLDEADRMLDMGFIHDIKKVLRLVPAKRQNLLFSATFNKDIKKLASSILTNPVLVEATPENTTAEKVDQKTYRVDKSRKTEMLIKFINEGNWDQVLVFTRTKHGANRLSQKLDKAGITSAAIHGNKTQNARVKALAGFKSGKIRVLVATDIAARGLDIPLLPYVINYELPNVPEDYVHRIGRTGRAGASGQAISLVGVDEVAYVRGIEKLLGEKLHSEVLEGFQPTDTIEQLKKEAAENKARHQQGRRNSRNNKPSGNRGGDTSNSRSNKSRRRR